MRAAAIRAFSWALLFALLTISASPALAGDDRRAGDVLRFAMPAGVVAYELWRGDDQGLWHFGKSWMVTMGATEVLKRSTHIQRPDGSDELSFPSCHASHAFAAATYMHRRHALRAAPLSPALDPGVSAIGYSLSPWPCSSCVRPSRM